MHLKTGPLRTLGRLVSIALVAAFAASGCHLTTSKEDVEPETGETHYTGHLLVNPDFAKRVPRRVAILPFVNKTESSGAESVVRQSFANHFATKNYEDVELATVDRKLAAAGIDSAEKAAQATPKELGSLLRADAVVRGEITNFDRLYAVLGSMVTVGAKIWMLDCETDETLWEVSDVSRVHEGGISINPIEAMGRAADAAFNTRKLWLMRGSDDLFREMVKVIPEPTSPDKLVPPTITSLVQDSPGLTRRAGEKILVALVGAPGCEASFDLGSFKKAIPMKEGKEGIYEGSYVVQPGDEARDLVVKGALEDSRGAKSEWTDALGAVSIDAKIPSAPQELTAEAGNGAATLRWAKSAETDLAGYVVYRSTTPLSGYQKALDTEQAEAHIEKLANGTRVYFRVTARDRAGNESEPAGPVEVLPLGGGPTAVGAVVEGESTWHAASGPYVVAVPAELPPGGELTIEPGTEVVLEANLTIAGQITARGTIEKPITFRGKGGALVLRGTAGAESALVGCRVSGATVSVEAGAPLIESMVIEGAPIGLVVKAGAKPVVRASRVARSVEHGIWVEDSPPLEMAEIEVAENGGDGIRCLRSTLSVTNGRLWGNKGAGVRSIRCSATVSKSSILKNGEAGVANDSSSPEALAANDNWWGSADPFVVARAVQGKVVFDRILADEPGEGKPIEVHFAGAEIKGPIRSDTFLIAANGPFSVADEVVVAEGGTLFIAPSSELRYVSSGAKIVLDGGRLVAEGTARMPIVFTSGRNPPHPGDYATAVEVRTASRLPSVLKHASIRFASHGVVVSAGEMEIAYCAIRENLQSGVRVGGSAAPKLSSNTIRDNRGTAGVEISDEARPRLEGNNIQDNSWAIQSSTSQFVYAERNWWGVTPPDSALFIGNVDWEHWLEAPAQDAP